MRDRTTMPLLLCDCRKSASSHIKGYALFVQSAVAPSRPDKSGVLGPWQRGDRAAGGGAKVTRTGDVLRATGNCLCGKPFDVRIDLAMLYAIQQHMGMGPQRVPAEAPPIAQFCLALLYCASLVYPDLSGLVKPYTMEQVVKKQEHIRFPQEKPLTSGHTS